MIQGVDKYLTQDVDIYQVTESQDEHGASTTTTTKRASVKGRMRKLKGNEKYISDKTNETVDYRLYLRPTTMEVTDQVLYNSVYYDVESINDVMEFEQFMQIDLRVAK